jgi:hypothetical protein
MTKFYALMLDTIFANMIIKSLIDNFEKHKLKVWHIDVTNFLHHQVVKMHI